jgi:hypothetical protein
VRKRSDCNHVSAAIKAIGRTPGSREEGGATLDVAGFEDEDDDDEDEDENEAHCRAKL